MEEEEEEAGEWMQGCKREGKKNEMMQARGEETRGGGPEHASRTGTNRHAGTDRHTGTENPCLPSHPSSCSCNSSVCVFPTVSEIKRDISFVSLKPSSTHAGRSVCLSVFPPSMRAGSHSNSFLFYLSEKRSGIVSVSLILSGFHGVLLSLFSCLDCFLPLLKKDPTVDPLYLCQWFLLLATSLTALPEESVDCLNVLIRPLHSAMHLFRTNDLLSYSCDICDPLSPCLCNLIHCNAPVCWTV